jgi:hypothetical protein
MSEQVSTETNSSAAPEAKKSKPAAKAKSKKKKVVKAAAKKKPIKKASKKKAVKKTAPKKAPKKAIKKLVLSSTYGVMGKPPKQTKVSFILAQPAAMKAHDVVAAGKKVGLDMSEQYVHSQRSAARHGTGKTRARGAVSKSNGVPSGSAAEFKTLLRNIGLEKARELITEFERT